MHACYIWRGVRGGPAPKHLIPRSPRASCLQPGARPTAWGWGRAAWGLCGGCWVLAAFLHPATCCLTQLCARGKVLHVPTPCVCSAICPPVRLSVHPLIPPSIHPSTLPSIHPSICPGQGCCRAHTHHAMPHLYRQPQGRDEVRGKHCSPPSLAVTNERCAGMT